MKAIANPKTACSNREKFYDSFGGWNNECYTPEYAIKPLLPYLKKDSIIWDCAFGSGRLAKHFNKFGFNVIGFINYNFLQDDSESIGNFDYIITNPPFSFKDDFLRRAFEIGKPFAFLLPLTALEGIKRGKLFMENGIQLIIPNRRINFDIPSGKKSSWYATAWFCYKFNLPKDLNFVELSTASPITSPTATSFNANIICNFKNPLVSREQLNNKQGVTNGNNNR